MSDLHTTVDMLADAWTGLRMHQPLSPVVLGDWPIPRTVGAVADARHHIRNLAARVIGYSSLAGDVELLAGELLANAVEHGGGDQTQVCVTADQQTVRVQIHDQGARPVERSAEVDPLAERGRGLLIVASFAARWGLDHDECGTTAWFEVRIP